MIHTDAGVVEGTILVTWSIGPVVALNRLELVDI